jgi:glycosyltransferase involved in cell wall biosynthesis
MTDVVIDFERLKNPNTGLYSFCKDLGNELIKNKENLDLTFYIPKKEETLFNNKVFFYNPIHKILKPKTSNLWHLTHQGSKFGGNKNILTIHDLNFLIEKKDNPEKIKSSLSKIQKNINRSEKIICISKFVANQIYDYLDLKNKTVEVIYNGCSLNEFPNFDSPNYRPKSKFLFSIGTVFRKKNFHVLSNLLVNNDFELVIAGILSDKSYIDEIISVAKANGVLDRLHLVGAITEPEKYWYYNNCTAFVFPSIAEGFGLPVVEAMRLGKPVFLSKLNSLPEVGGDHAFYFENFEKQNMIQTFEQAIPSFENKELKQKIIQHSNQFSWETAAKRYIEIYKLMI